MENTSETSEMVQRGIKKIDNMQKAANSQQIEFLMNTDLSYALEGNKKESNKELSVKDEQACFVCKAKKTSIEGAKLLNCARCKIAAYCSKECQVMDWKAGHKFDCQTYKRLGSSMTLEHVNHKREAIVNGVLSRIRFYSGPFAVHHHNKQGRGFLFLQSPCTLGEMSLLKPISSLGKKIEPERSIIMHFLTLGEFDQELCKDDFELAIFRGKMKEAVDTYNSKEEIVIFLRFRCGHVALLKAPLVPEYKIALKLAEDYEDKPGAIQLQIDNV